MNEDKEYENYFGPFITEFSVLQGNKTVHILTQRNTDKSLNFTIRLGLFNRNLGEQFEKVHIDLIPANLRANPTKPTAPGSKGRESVIPKNGNESFVFDADYNLDMLDYPIESANFFMVYIYLLGESLRDGQYQPNLILRTMIPRQVI